MSEAPEPPDDADTLQAIEAIRLLNEALPEMPYPSDFNFDLYGDIDFQHYEQVLGGWTVYLLLNVRQNASILRRVFAFVESMATSGDKHCQGLISVGFCEELACEIPRASLRMEARSLMGPRTAEMFDAEIESHAWDDAWGEEWHGKSIGRRDRIWLLPAPTTWTDHRAAKDRDRARMSARTPRAWRRRSRNRTSIVRDSPECIVRCEGARPHPG